MTIDKKLLEQISSDANTIVLVLDAGNESQIAMRWLQKNAPKALMDQRVWTDIRLMQLMAPMSVCAVFRMPISPAVNYGPDLAGVIRTSPRPDSELFEEMKVTTPVKVGDYWLRPSPTSLGQPDVPRFLEALQATLVPYRLDYIDKGEQRPNIMKLASL